MTEKERESRCILFDWGDTLMRIFPQFRGPMLAWPRIEAIPHARDVLEQLHAEWVTALATNAAASEEGEIWTALKRVDLAKFLDKVYCFRIIGHQKPSPEFFKYILKDLCMEPSQVVMVGDDFEGDVLGANRCGIRAIWFNARSSKVKEEGMHHTIHDLRSLHQALKLFMDAAKT